MTRLAARFGFRGLWLIVIGGVWMCFGAGLLLDPEGRIPGAFHQLIPYRLRAVAWIGTGLLAVAVGIRGRTIRSDAAGHVALWLMPGLRLTSFLGSWLLALVTSDLGSTHAWYAAAIWGLVVAMLMLVAAWPNPEPSIIPAPPSREEGR